MLVDEPVGLFHHGGWHLLRHELEMPGHGSDDRGRDLFIVEPGGAVGQGARGAGIPVQFERPIDGDEDVSDPLSVIDNDHTADMSGATNQTLTDTHHLDSPADVDGPFPRAVLTAELSDTRVDPETFEGIDHGAGDEFESLRDPGSGLLLRGGPSECQGLLVEYGRSTPGETLDRPKAVRLGDTDCLRVAGLNTIYGAEGHHGTWDMQPDETVDLAPGYSAKGGMAHRGIESWMLGVGIGDKCVSTHNQEDKEPGVTVSGSIGSAGNRDATGLVDRKSPWPEAN